MPDRCGCLETAPRITASNEVTAHGDRSRKMTTTCCTLVVAACLLWASWVVVEGQQVTRLKTRDSDGAPMCAQDEPSRLATTSARMSNAPAVVGCAMTCTGDHQCHHFNYVDNDSLHPCHLYYYTPTRFEVQPHCIHYYTGKQLETIVRKSR